MYSSSSSGAETWGLEMCACVEIQLEPSRDRAYPDMQRWTTHSPDRQETSATPGMAVQSWPIGENGVRGSTHPPPEIKNIKNIARHARQTHSQLSRSRAVLTHSQARAPPPNTPQAAQPCPISVQEPLPTQRLWGVAWLEGHAPRATHWPLQTMLDPAQVHVVGFSGGEAV
jgi:hypothetical protein